ncbi:MAG: nucleotide sugar dehydrogenase [Candidatus Ancillula sp.]|jgi:UDP-N-acetyl-D-glucosamine dehydrogenase|nr:nucleotide sugar dehydrogenase [Candidatus Ancillula sp.]
MREVNANLYVVGIIGGGYVGLPNAVYYAERGAEVVVFDTDESVVAGINSGISHIADVENEVLLKLVSAGRIRATQDFTQIANCQYIFIDVPTPLKHGEKQPSYVYIDMVASSLAEYLPKGKGVVVFLESTVAPGDTFRYLIHPLQEAGYKLDVDVYVCFFPERINPGGSFDFRRVSRVLGGSKLATRKASHFFSALKSSQELQQEITTVSSIETAELSKILENTYRYVNIALINEFAKVAQKIGVDITEAIDAAGTKPYGFQKFYPNIKIGGHCIPVDPFYLYNSMQELGIEMPLLKAASSVNDSMLNFGVEKIVDALDKPLKVANIALIGATYKKNIADVRESAAFVLKNRLQELGASVELFDPLIYPKTWKNDYTDFDLVVLLVGHTCVDIDELKSNSKLFVNLDFDLKK